MQQQPAAAGAWSRPVESLPAGEEGSPRVEQQTRPGLCLSLLLPPPLEAAFHSDRSVQRILALFDVATVIQALAVNGRFLRVRLSHTSEQETHSLMLQHEEVMAVLFIVLALAQGVFMLARPKVYLQHRYAITVANRLLRVLLVVISAVALTPRLALQQGMGYVLASNGTQTLLGGSGSSSSTPGGCPACLDGPYAATADSSIDVWATAKMLLAGASIFLVHANFLVGFRLAVVMQLLTCAGSIAANLKRVCPTLTSNAAGAASAVPACHALGWLAGAGGALLDLQQPAAAADDGGGSFAGVRSLCDHPLSAIILMKIWVDLVMLVLLPCCAVWCLEWSLKTNYLMSRAAASSPSSAAPPQQEQEQALEQLLARLAPLSPLDVVVPEPTPEAHCCWWAWAVRIAGMLFAAVACWHLCEAVLSALLHGRRQLVCDADGWITLV